MPAAGDCVTTYRRLPGGAWSGRRHVRDLHRNSSRDGYARMSLYAPSHAVVRAELARRYRGPLAPDPPRRQSA